MDVSENGRSVFDEQVQSDVREVFRVINQQWTSKDVPVVISEWGTILKADNEESRREHASYYVEIRRSRHARTRRARRCRSRASCGTTAASRM